MIAEHLAFGESTITRALDKAGVTMRPKFRRVAQAALCSAARMSRATPNREPLTVGWEPMTRTGRGLVRLGLG
jgi:hypothetical protein